MRLILASAILASTCVAAFAAPPEGQKLSEIIAKIEQNADVLYVDEADWSNRYNSYKIEYVMKNGAKATIRIDPKTGEAVKKRR